MTDPTTDDLATLARAMGYTVTLDDSGGYGVVRVVYEYAFHGVQLRAVFQPHNDAAQAWEVMAWLGRKCAVAHEVYDDGRHGLFYASYGADAHETLIHDGTGKGTSRAVVEAAIRVAKG